MPEPLTYSEYIRDFQIVQALDLPDAARAGVSADDWPRKPPGWKPGDDWPTGPNWVHDEVLFIRTHQAFEVWFALILHELTSVVREADALDRDLAFEDPKLHRRAVHAGAMALDPTRWPQTVAVIDRRRAADPAMAGAFAGLCTPGHYHVATVFPPHFGEGDSFYHALLRWNERIGRAAKALLGSIAFFDILSTMPPANFLKFRGRLQPASGFGSAQFREIEYLLGLRELHEKKLQPEGGEPSDTEPLWKPSGNTPSDQRAMSFYVAQTAWGRERVARRARETSLRDVVYGLLNAAFLAGSRPEGPEKGLPDMRPAAIDRLVAKCVNSTLDDHYRGASAGRLDAAGIKLLGGAVQSLNESLIHRETIAATLIEARPEKELFAAFLDVCLEPRPLAAAMARPAYPFRRGYDRHAPRHRRRRPPLPHRHRCLDGLVSHPGVPLSLAGAKLRAVTQPPLTLPAPPAGGRRFAPRRSRRAPSGRCRCP